MNYVMDFTRSVRKAEDGVSKVNPLLLLPLAAGLFTGDSGNHEFVRPCL